MALIVQKIQALPSNTKVLCLESQRQNPNDTLALKKITPAHSSHLVAPSQVCPNNLNRAVLTPLDLIDATPSNSDAPTHGYQGSQTHSSPNISHQSSSSLVIPISGGSMMLQGSPSLVLSNGLPSSSRSLSGQARLSRSPMGNNSNIKGIDSAPMLQCSPSSTCPGVSGSTKSDAPS